MKFVNDSFGQPTMVSYYKANGSPNLYGNYCIKRKSYDNRGNMVEESYFGVRDEPVNNSSGYHRVTLEYNAKGQKTFRQYFGKDHNPAYGPDGYHRMEPENGKNHYFDAANREISDVEAKNKVQLIYVDHIESVNTPAARIGMQAGDVLWRFGDWSFTEALDIAGKKFPAKVDEVNKLIWSGFVAARNAAKTKPSRLVVIRNKKPVHLQVPMLTGDGKLGFNVQTRSLPGKFFEQWAHVFSKEGQAKR
ncbi:MAG: hypothetical protein HQK89_13245 [Nitrospirae bacterium]|nr:hypothetical protein [Nitrospirota bacterium]